MRGKLVTARAAAINSSVLPNFEIAFNVKRVGFISFSAAPCASASAGRSH